MTAAKLFQRFLILCLFAFWFGGLTFYAVIVIPTGAKVLGSHTEQGFVTQQVTKWLNVIGVAGTLMLAWNLKIMWRCEVQIPRKRLTATWIVILLAQAALLLVHPVMDKMLDTTVHSISEPIPFYNWHRVYLASVTLLWLGGMSHFWFLLRSWHANNVVIVRR